MSAPRAGTLEWLADARPDEAVLLADGDGLTRARWEHEANGLAEVLHARGVRAGDIVTHRADLGPRSFVLTWACAKLGAGAAFLPLAPTHLADVPGTWHAGSDVMAARRPLHPPRRLSGTHPPPPSVTFSRTLRPVRRTFTPDRLVAIGATLADLVARTRAVPGTTLVAAGPAADARLLLQATVVLVGGGRVATGVAAPASLALVARHEATALVLPPAGLDELARTPDADLEALDLLGLQTVVTGGARVSAAARALADDLFGPGLLVDVYATADAGDIAVRAGAEERHTLLDGVEARVDRGGRLEVRSPLTAGGGWTPTGDRAELDGRALALAPSPAG